MFDGGFRGGLTWINWGLLVFFLVFLGGLTWINWGLVVEVKLNITFCWPFLPIIGDVHEGHIFWNSVGGFLGALPLRKAQPARMEDVSR